MARNFYEFNEELEKTNNPYRNTVQMTHGAYVSPYQQFKQQYPEIDAYGNKVLSGGYLKDNLRRFKQAGRNARLELQGKQPETEDNLMDYFGMGGITKVNPWEMTKDLYNKPAKLKPEEYSYIDIGHKKVEVAQNPSSSELSAMRREAVNKHGEPAHGDPALRHTQDADGNTYYWDAYDSIHAHIEPQLSKKLGVAVNQNAANKMSHRGIVRRAIYEGESVPNNVLLEYPGIIDEVMQIPGNKIK